MNRTTQSLLSDWIRWQRRCRLYKIDSWHIHSEREGTKDLMMMIGGSRDDKQQLYALLIALVSRPSPCHPVCSHIQSSDICLDSRSCSPTRPVARVARIIWIFRVNWFSREILDPTLPQRRVNKTVWYPDKIHSYSKQVTSRLTRCTDHHPALQTLLPTKELLS